MNHKNILSLTLALFLTCSQAFAGVTFDAADDILFCGNSDAMLRENAALTISAWIFPITQGEANQGQIVNRTDTAFGTISGIRFAHVATNRLSFQVLGGTALTHQSVDSTIVLNTWQHVLVTWDGSTTAANSKIYLNGTEVSYVTTTNGVTLADNSANTTKIGNRDALSTTYDGTISEVAVWSSVLNTSDIVNLASSRTKRIPLQVSPSTLQAYWPLAACAEGASCDGMIFNDMKSTNHCTGDNGANNTGLTGKAEVLTYQ